MSIQELLCELAFLAQFESPLAIDKITKAPDLFDGIKSKVDKQRIPGQFIITGFTQFSAKLGIRESLTGRIGIVKMNPLCFAKAQQVDPLRATVELWVVSGSLVIMEILSRQKPLNILGDDGPPRIID